MGVSSPPRKFSAFALSAGHVRDPSQPEQVDAEQDQGEPLASLAGRNNSGKLKN
jgi:hypothetical protein